MVLDFPFGCIKWSQEWDFGCLRGERLGERKMAAAGKDCSDGAIKAIPTVKEQDYWRKLW